MSLTSTTLPGLTALTLLFGLSSVEAPATRSLQGAAAHVDALTLGGEPEVDLRPLIHHLPGMDLKPIFRGDASLDPLDPRAFEGLRGRVAQVLGDQRRLEATGEAAAEEPHSIPSIPDDGYLPDALDFDEESAEDDDSVA